MPLSLTLLVIGGASLIAKGGLYYGIDFKGGTVVYVRFAGTPPVDQLRSGLVKEGLGQSVIQPISDIASPNSNEVMIGLEEKGQGSEALDAGKTAILNALHATLGSGEAGKQDFNAAGPAAISDVADPQGSAEVWALPPADRYAQLARQIVAFRDKDSRGIVTNLDDLSSAGASTAVIAALRDAFYTSNFAIIECGNCGPEGRLRASPPGRLGHSLRLGGHVSLYCISFRVGVWCCRRVGSVSRRSHYIGSVFDFSF